jgi:hypothetical protein
MTKIRARDLGIPLDGNQLLQIFVAAPALNLVVTSRAPSDFPPLLKSRRVEVRGLNWNGQSAIIRAELGDEAAMPVLDLLAKDTRFGCALRGTGFAFVQSCRDACCL